MWMLKLPELGGTRDVAARLVEARIEDDPLEPESEVVVMARALLSTSASFSDELVRVLLEDNKASKLVLVAAPRKFERQVHESAQRRGFDDRVFTKTAAGAGI